MKRLLLVPAVGGMVLALASPAAAQFGGRTDRYYGSSGIAYDNGYREGVPEGQKDARSRDPFEFRDEGDWRNGERGYRREYGDRGRYRQSFRAGFEAGYAAGYRQYAPGIGYGRGRALPRGNPRVDSPYPNRRPDVYGYPGGYGYPGNDRYGYGSHPAHAAGLRDGYEKGREDARDRDRYDPVRHGWYRSGDRDYRREYGSREQYRDLYRQAFRQGYERGYREWAYRR